MIRLCMLLAWVVLWPAQTPPAEATAPPPPANWRFRRADKPVKVVVLAGSIGAYQRQSYAKEIERLCHNVEIKNLSKTGLGAWALKKRFKHQVLANRRLDLGDPAFEYWLLFGGGLNSVGSPKTTSHHIKNIFVLARMASMGVVALTLTPWGDDAVHRFRGIGGLRLRKATKHVSDFIMGRLSPSEALGSYASRRPDGTDGPWRDLERPTIAIDVYDSALRDPQASGRDLAVMHDALAKDKDWNREHRRLSAQERQQALARDAKMAADLPKWYLRPELRSFDHVHPNSEGHRIIAATMCPALPARWGCACEAQ